MMFQISLVFENLKGQARLGSMLDYSEFLVKEREAFDLAVKKLFRDIAKREGRRDKSH